MWLRMICMKVDQILAAHIVIIQGSVYINKYARDSNLYSDVYSKQM